MQIAKKIGIVVLTWNDSKNTIECLNSIIKSDYNKYDIILVNNNSKKDHILQIKKWGGKKILEINKNYKIGNTGQKKIYLLNSNKVKNQKWAVNLGCTAGLNLGYKFCLNQKYDFIARIDCDFIITKNYLSGMIKSLTADEDIVAISPKIMHASLRWNVLWHNFKFKWNFLKFQKTMNLKKYRLADNKILIGEKEVDAICGCCSVYRTSILKKSGLGDEDFFFGPEDIELSFRLKKFGKLIANLNYKTYHKVASSIDVSGIRPRAYFEAIGWLLLIKKIGSLSDKFIGYSYFLLRIPYYLMLSFFKKNNKERYYGFCEGTLKFFKKY
jgi:GT2 family glycosyltransferase